MQSNEQQYENINIPDFSDMYKLEAQKLLKMINEQMVEYYNRSYTEDIDVFNIYQVLKKIESFESKIPGIEVLKENLIKDIQQMVTHLESSFQEKRKKYATELLACNEQILRASAQRKTTILKIIFLHWFLIPKLFELNKEITNLKKLIKAKEQEELNEKRASFNEAQLIYISHRFREKYLNIPLPEDLNKNLF